MIPEKFIDCLSIRGKIIGLLNIKGKGSCIIVTSTGSWLKEKFDSYMLNLGF